MKQRGNVFVHQFAISALQQRQLSQTISNNSSHDSRLGCQSNGWTSPKMHQDKAKAWPLGYFINRISDLLASVAGAPHPLRYWFVCMEQGGTIAWHDHDQADWAGVFYPHDADIDDGGQIMFESGEIIQPKAGLFVAFPGTLKHQVMAYNGSTARYSVAFNRDPQASQ